jgi:membrane associated rhomboid family serine protease
MKVTGALIALNLIGFVWEIIVGGPGMLSATGGGNIDRVMQEGSLYPAAVLQNGEWWRIFTGAFLHGGLIHIAVNMISLWSLGRVKANTGILVLNLIITFTVPSISWQAHVAGLAAGFLLTLAIYHPPRRVAPVVVDARTGAELETEYQAPNPPNPHSQA